MVGKYLNPRNDRAFKKIFGSEKNKKILLALLNNVLTDQIHRPITKVTFLQRAQDAETKGRKTSIVDLMCHDEDDCRYIIEMQVEYSDGYKERAQHYAAKAYSSQALSGGDYAGLKKVIFLAFANYGIFPKKDNHKSDHQVLDIITKENDLDKICFTFIDLVKFNKNNKKPIIELSLEEKFYLFLHKAEKITPEELSAITKDEPIMQQVFHELDSYYWTEKERIEYEAAEKKVHDHLNEIRSARNKGIQQGRSEGRASTLKELVNKGLISPEKAFELMDKKIK